MYIYLFLMIIKYSYFIKWLHKILLKSILMLEYVLDINDNKLHSKGCFHSLMK